MKTAKISKNSSWIHGKSFPLLSSFLLFSGNVLAREFVTERPDKARTAYSIEKGRIAIEPELINYAVQNESDMHTLSAGEIFIRAGITKNSELQINTDSYVDQTSEKKTTKKTGNTELGWKYNLYGNDEGNSAVALQPYVIIPTASGGQDKKWEGGLAFNFEWQFIEKNYLGITVEPNNVRKDDDLEWQTSLISIVSYARPFFHDRIYIFFEIFHEEGKTSEQPQITTLDIALQYEIRERFFLDIGTFVGVSPDADDMESFFGGSYLF